MKYVANASLKNSIWALSLVSLLACGRWASAPEQEVKSLPIPEYPSFDRHVLSLQDGITSIGYGGTLLIFNENTTPDLIADVLQASIDSRLAWAEVKKFEVENRYVELYSSNGIVKNAIEYLKDELRHFEAQALAAKSVPLEEKKANAKDWLQQELDLLYGEEPSVDRQRAEAMFGYYCQAKLIELATDSYFAARQYLERPTPLAFCESYYEAQGYFQSEICAAEPGRGKSYFECLWRDGVFHTYWFKEVYLNEELDAERANKISQLLSEENLPVFQAVMSLDESVMQVSSALRVLIFGRDGNKRDYFSQLIMRQQSGKATCTRTIPNLQTLCLEFEIKTDTSQNVPDFSGLDEGEAYPHSPFETINLMEEKNTDNQTYFPMPARPDSTVTTKEILAFYAQRGSSDYRNSENDLHFHLLASGEPLPRPKQSERLTTIMGEIQKALTPTIYPELSGQEREEYNKRLALIQQFEREVQTANRTLKDLEDQTTVTSIRGFAAGAAGDIEAGTHVAHGFIEIVMKVTNFNGIVRVDFQTKDYLDYAIAGCFHLAEQRQLSWKECEANTNSTAKHVLPASRVFINSDTGRLDFGFEITKPDEIGLGFKERKFESNSGTHNSFMDLTSDELFGKRLEFELYPNRIYDHLEILTGKAFIRFDGQDLYEAGVSMWDQNQ